MAKSASLSSTIPPSILLSTHAVLLSREARPWPKTFIFPRFFDRLRTLRAFMHSTLVASELSSKAKLTPSCQSAKSPYRFPPAVRTCHFLGGFYEFCADCALCIFAPWRNTFPSSPLRAPRESPSWKPKGWGQGGNIAVKPHPIAMPSQSTDRQSAGRRYVDFGFQDR
jgi:hypothetical protein